VSWGADEIIKLSSENAKLNNLEMQSDLASSRAIANDLRNSIFALARVVDINSFADKLGSLTNFGLRVLYSDALSKNELRRGLYGDALMEINRRCLVMNDFEGTNTLTWGNDMPANENEDAALIYQDLAAGLTSKETAAEERGYMWKSTINEAGVLEMGEEEKIRTEAATNNAAGNLALANLFTGRQVP
jgi:hypothetical protein